MQISDNVRLLEPSATLAVAARARELRAAGRDILDVSAGEPDVNTPEFVARAGIRAIEDGHTRYTPAAGIPALRAAIAADLSRRTGADVDPAGIVVTAGAKQALFNAFFSLFGPGDRVLVPAPYWTSYPPLLGISRAEAVPVPGDPAAGFKVGPRELDMAWRPAVRGIVLNSPCNPTGAVYDRAELETIARWALERELWIVSDEIYGRISYAEEAAPSMLALDPALRPRLVVVDGASKSFAMTGWRLGFSASDPGLAATMTALQSHTTSNASSPAQHAALAAYAEPEHQAAAVSAMLAMFRRRRDLVVTLFRELLPGVDFVPPEGAFYLFFRTEAFGPGSSLEVCTRLLEECGVAVVPGEAFGEDGFARLSYAASDQTLEDAVRRLAGVLEAGRHPSSAGPG